jgi:hypothetical protein
MEIAAQYDRPLTNSARWQVYGGPAAEPALGPAAYPQRISATPNLLAPIARHWLDATHITFGVLTGGIYGNRWKAEAEPGEDGGDRVDVTRVTASATYHRAVREGGVWATTAAWGTSGSGSQ